MEFNFSPKLSLPFYQNTAYLSILFSWRSKLVSKLSTKWIPN